MYPNPNPNPNPKQTENQQTLMQTTHSGSCDVLLFGGQHEQNELFRLKNANGIHCRPELEANCCSVEWEKGNFRLDGVWRRRRRMHIQLYQSKLNMCWFSCSLKSTRKGWPLCNKSFQGHFVSTQQGDIGWNSTSIKNVHTYETN